MKAPSEKRPESAPGAATQPRASAPAELEGRRPVSVIIADDESLARETLGAALAEYSDFEIVANCSNGMELVEVATSLRPEVIFLDIQMPRLDGFTAITRLPEPKPLVVFVTAFDEHAIRAFEVNGFDYVLKPFTSSRLATTIGRLRERLGRSAMPGEDAARPAQESSPELRGAKPYLTRFSVRTKELLSLVAADEVDWIEADGNYSVLHTGKRSHILRETLGTLEKGLNPADFIRVSRSAIVRLDRVRQIDTSFTGNYSLILIDGSRVRTTRTLGELSTLLKFS